MSTITFDDNISNTLSQFKTGDFFTQLAPTTIGSLDFTSLDLNSLLDLLKSLLDDMAKLLDLDISLDLDNLLDDTLQDISNSLGIPIEMRSTILSLLKDTVCGDLNLNLDGLNLGINLMELFSISLLIKLSMCGPNKINIPSLQTFFYSRGNVATLSRAIIDSFEILGNNYQSPNHIILRQDTTTALELVGSSASLPSTRDAIDNHNMTLLDLDNVDRAIGLVFSNNATSPIKLVNDLGELIWIMGYVPKFNTNISKPITGLKSLLQAREEIKDFIISTKSTLDNAYAAEAALNNATFDNNKSDYDSKVVALERSSVVEKSIKDNISNSIDSLLPEVVKVHNTLATIMSVSISLMDREDGGDIIDLLDGIENNDLSDGLIIPIMNISKVFQGYSPSFSSYEENHITDFKLPNTPQRPLIPKKKERQPTSNVGGITHLSNNDVGGYNVEFIKPSEVIDKKWHDYGSKISPKSEEFKIKGENIDKLLGYIDKYDLDKSLTKHVGKNYVGKIKKPISLYNIDQVLTPIELDYVALAKIL